LVIFGSARRVAGGRVHEEAVENGVEGGGGSIRVGIDVHLWIIARKGEAGCLDYVRRGASSCLSVTISGLVSRREQDKKSDFDGPCSVS
jgi:hypothetical protein